MGIFGPSITSNEIEYFDLGYWLDTMPEISDVVAQKSLESFSARPTGEFLMSGDAGTYASVLPETNNSNLNLAQTTGDTTPPNAPYFGAALVSAITSLKVKSNIISKVVTKVINRISGKIISR